MLTPSPMRLLFVGSILICLSSQLKAAQQIEADEIAQRSIEVSQKDWKQTPEYDYVEREQDDGKSRTYKVIMLLGSRYRRLVAINDQLLSADAQAREEQLFQKALAHRQHETPQQREQRLAQEKKETSQQDLFLEQMVKAFHFTFLGRETRDSREVYVLRAKPRRDYRPPNARAKALTGMEGALWIDATDFHWVRVEAEVKHPVSIEGFFARVEPGTRFELEQRPLPDGLWLPTRFSMRARAKVLLFFSHNEQEESTYYGYHKAIPAD